RQRGTGGARRLRHRRPGRRGAAEPRLRQLRPVRELRGAGPPLQDRRERTLNTITTDTNAYASFGVQSMEHKPTDAPLRIVGGQLMEARRAALAEQAARQPQAGPHRLEPVASVRDVLYIND